MANSKSQINSNFQSFNDPNESVWSFGFGSLDSNRLKCENLSLTIENKKCHAEIDSASRFVYEVRS